MPKLIEQSAKAIYGCIPTFMIAYEYDTTGSNKKVEVRYEDTWEEAEDRHEELKVLANAVLDYLTSHGFLTLDAIVAIQAEKKGARE